MGEISDSMIGGECCQVCGDYLGSSTGYPRTCGDCGGGDDLEEIEAFESEMAEAALQASKRQQAERKSGLKSCPRCGDQPTKVNHATGIMIYCAHGRGCRVRIELAGEDIERAKALWNEGAASCAIIIASEARP